METGLNSVEFCQTVRYNADAVRRDPIVDRIRRQVRRLMRLPGQPRVTQQQMAKALQLSHSQVSNFLTGRYGIVLKHVDVLADLLGTTASELVRDGRLPLYELSKVEAQVVEYMRRWPPEVRAAFIDVLDFLHAKVADDPLSPQMFDYWGRLGKEERAIVFAAAVRLREERLTPELRAQLLSQDASAGSGSKTGKSSTTP